MCRSPKWDDGVVILSDVVNTLRVAHTSIPADVKMYAVVGAVIRAPMWDKPLDLMAWQLGNNGERESPFICSGLENRK